MSSVSLSMFLKNYKVGDSICLFYNNHLVVKGIIYIMGSIPIERFYAKKYKKTNHHFNDLYEDAIVIIDDKNSENLVVLTLESDDHKLFVWNDIFDVNKEFNYQSVPNLDNISIKRNEVFLTEIQYSFK